MAALALEDDRERLAGMLDQVLRTMECFLSGFGGDGGCSEGIDYWAYGFGFYIYFAATLREFTGGRLDLIDNDLVPRIAAFPQAVSLGQGAYLNYSDASEQAVIPPGLGSHLAARFQQPIPGLAPPNFHADHAYRWGHVTRDLLWTSAAALHAPVVDGAHDLPDLAWVVDRRILAGRTLAFSAKGGHNDEPHNHNDLGHFIVHLGGESLLADLGAGIYTRQYFGPERYQSPNTGSHGHSVPLINGQPQRDGRAHAATVLLSQFHPDGVEFSLDLTRAYAGAGLQSFVRAFAWTVDFAVGRATLRLTDTFRFTAPPAIVEEYFISLRSPTLADGAATWTGQRGTVTMRYDRGQFEPSIELITAQAHHGAPYTVYRLRLRGAEGGPDREAVFDFVCCLAAEA